MQVEVTVCSAGLQHRGLSLVALKLIGSYKVDLLKSPHTSPAAMAIAKQIDKSVAVLRKPQMLQQGGLG